MPNAAYDELRSNLPAGGMDWLTDTFKVTLVGSGYTYNATHTNLAALGANQLSGVTPATLNVTNVDSVGNVEVDSVTLAGVTAAQTCKAAIVYQDLGGGVTKLCWYFDTGTGFPLTTTGADITIDWNGTAANGIQWKAG